jgi:hypothetical protein
MTRYAIICFEHDRRVTREIEPPCLDLDIDVHVPWSWVEASIGEVHIGDAAKNLAENPDLRGAGTIGSIGSLADRYQPLCPACKEPLRFVAWSIEDYEDEDTAKS